jgi:acyl transferase domain-containing protein
LTGYPVLPFIIDQSAPRGLSIDQSEIAQICIFIFKYSLCTWLESLGIYAHTILGHSLGGIAAAGMLLVMLHDFILLINLISDFLLVGLQFVVVRATLLCTDARPGMSVCTLLESIHAHAALGHSLGEIAAAGMIAYHVTSGFK